MKTLKLTLIALMMMITAGSYAQRAPSAVTEAFNKKFENTSNVKWDKENAHEYEASFKINDTKYSANFSDKGEWLETETITDFDKLPAKVQEAFKANYGNTKVKLSSVIETPGGNKKYEVEYKKGEKTVEVLYDENGNIVK